MIESWDLETHLIDRALLAPPIVSTAWKNSEGEHLELWSPDHFLEMVRGGRIVVGQNVAYDCACVMATEPGLIPAVFELYEHDRVEDLKLNQRLIDIASGAIDYHDKVTGYDLGAIAGRYGIEVDKSDPWRLRYRELADTPVDLWPLSARHYALLDVRAPYDVWHRQRELDQAWTQRMGSPILHQAPHRARYALSLHLAECWGVRTHEGRTKALMQATERHMLNLRKELVAAGLVRKVGSRNMNAAKARVREAFAAQGRPAPLTETGEKKRVVPGSLEAEKYTATDADTMILTGDPVCAKYADYTTTVNLINRLQDLLEGVDMPLQPSYNSLLATGRTSCRKGEKEKKGGKSIPSPLRGVQIQNNPRGTAEEILALVKELTGVPYGARECYRPRDGCVFVLADYGTAELHTLAQVCLDLFGYSQLGDLLNAGTDIHMWFGEKAYGDGIVTYEQALAQKKQKPYKAWRQNAKPIVFGVPGGMGPDKILLTARKSYRVTFTRDEAKRLRELYISLIAELKDYFAYIAQMTNGRPSGCTLRQLRSGRWRGRAGYSAAANSYFQGLCADGALQALWYVVQECYTDRSSALYGYRPITFVHDEIVLEGPEDRAHDAAMRLQAVMEREFNQYTPDVPTGAEPVVTRIWSKDAEPRFGPDGKLIPWELAA